ncbi:MAG: hypothetical protein CMF23_12370 [Ignavibacteriae bacterium]|nr:hypothetical protein [Ignavibacteriota bacterium]
MKIFIVAIRVLLFLMLSIQIMGQSYSDNVIKKFVQTVNRTSGMNASPEIEDLQISATKHFLFPKSGNSSMFEDLREKTNAIYNSDQSTSHQTSNKTSSTNYEKIYKQKFYETFNKYIDMKSVPELELLYMANFSSGNYQQALNHILALESKHRIEYRNGFKIFENGEEDIWNYELIVAKIYVLIYLEKFKEAEKTFKYLENSFHWPQVIYHEYAELKNAVESALIWSD